MEDLSLTPDLLDKAKRFEEDFPFRAKNSLFIKSATGQIKPLKLNRAQQFVHEKLEEQRKKQGYVRAVIVKARKEGISTLVAARYFDHVIRTSGQKAFILAHREDATSNLYDMVDILYENYPPFIRPGIKESNAKRLFFDNNSGYSVGTAGSGEVGRGDTIHYLHMCLAEGTLIYDPLRASIKPIQDFKIGDLVLTHKNQKAPISFISSKEKECLSVTFRTLGKFPLVASKEHKFWTKNGWKELGSLQIGDAIGYPVSTIIPSIKQLKLPSGRFNHLGGGAQKIYPDFIDLDYNFGRIAGLYLADGHIKLASRKPNYPSCVQFIVHKKEVVRTLDWLEPLKSYSSSINVKNREGSLTSVITVYGNRFCALLNELCGRVKDKHIPYDWRKMPEDFCRGLLHGYLAGDGASYDTCREVSASSIHPAITIPIRDLVASLGYGWGFIDIRPAAIRHGRNEKTRYLYKICGTNASKLAKEIGKPTPPIKRKATNSTKDFAAKSTEISNGYAWLRIRKIENVGIKKVYDFEVDHEDHSYCTIHGATHNSEVALYENGAKIVKGLMQAVYDLPGTEIIVESTANGRDNIFYNLTKIAANEASDYQLIFLPWFMLEEYRLPIPENFTLTEEEEQLKLRFKLDDEQLAWRRSKINGILGAGAFMNEFPATIEEAFQATVIDKLIPNTDVLEARNNFDLIEERRKPIIGIDPAGSGKDKSVIMCRRGRHQYKSLSFEKLNTQQIVEQIILVIRSERPAKVFIDKGYNPGIYDRLIELGYGAIVIGVQFGGEADENLKYGNKRAEMYHRMKTWFADKPVRIQDDEELHVELCAVGVKDSGGRNKIYLQEKKEIREAIGRSPDKADALALTFAYNVATYEDLNYEEEEEEERARSQQGRNRITGY